MQQPVQILGSGSVNARQQVRRAIVSAPVAGSTVMSTRSSTPSAASTSSIDRQRWGRAPSRRRGPARAPRRTRASPTACGARGAPARGCPPSAVPGARRSARAASRAAAPRRRRTPRRRSRALAAPARHGVRGERVAGQHRHGRPATAPSAGTAGAPEYRTSTLDRRGSGTRRAPA